MVKTQLLSWLYLCTKTKYTFLEDMKAILNFLIFPQANHPVLMATRQLTSVSNMWFLNLCDEVLSNLFSEHRMG